MKIRKIGEERRIRGKNKLTTVFVYLKLKCRKMVQNYGRAFKIIRSTLGLSQVEFAKALMVNASYISRIESGIKDPSLNVRSRLINRFNIPSELLEFLSIGEHFGLSSRKIQEFGEMFIKVLNENPDEIVS